MGIVALKSKYVIDMGDHNYSFFIVSKLIKNSKRATDCMAASSKSLSQLSTNSPGMHMRKHSRLSSDDILVFFRSLI